MPRPVENIAVKRRVTRTRSEMDSGSIFVNRKKEMRKQKVVTMEVVIKRELRRPKFWIKPREKITPMEVSKDVAIERMEG